MNEDNEYCTFTLPHSIRQALADFKNTIDDVMKGREVHYIEKCVPQVAKRKGRGDKGRGQRKYETSGFGSAHPSLNSSTRKTGH
jgi:hypothetical protein